MKRLEFTSGVSNVFSCSLPVAAPFPDKGKTFFLGREGEGAGCRYPYRSYRRFGCFMELLDMNTAAAIRRVELIKGFHCEKLQCSRHQTTDMKNHFFFIFYRKSNATRQSCPFFTVLFWGKILVHLKTLET